MKTYISLLTTLCISIGSHAQQNANGTKYFDKYWDETTESNAMFYRHYEYKEGLYHVADYYMSDKLQMVGTFKNLEKSINHGQFIYYYPDGSKQEECTFLNDEYDGEVKEYFIGNNQISAVKHYKKGVKDGEWICYHKNGQISKKIMYAKGKPATISCYTTAGSDTSCGKNTENFASSWLSLKTDEIPFSRYRNRMRMGDVDTVRSYENLIRKGYTLKNKDIYIPTYHTIKKIADTTYIISYHDPSDSSVLIGNYWCLEPEVRDGKFMEYKNGELVREFNYVKNKQEGEDILYSKGAKRKLLENYVNGKLEGDSYEYYPDGSVKCLMAYINDKETKKNCFAKNGNDTICADDSKEPDFKGGKSEMYKFLRDNITYPQKAKDKSIEGKVYCTFEISETGNVENVYITKGLMPEIDMEVYRVVNKMPDWIPGQIDGKNVNVRFNLPVEFKLN